MLTPTVYLYDNVYMPLSIATVLHVYNADSVYSHTFLLVLIIRNIPVHG